MKNHKLELKWAFIFCGMSLLWMLGERLSGLHDTYISHHPFYTNFVAIPSILIYVLALREKNKTHYHGYMSYKQSFLAGIYISVYVALLSPVVQLITFKIITPFYFENAIKFAVAHKKLTLEDAVDYFNLNSYMLQAFIGALFMGIVTSVIVSFFTASKKSAQAL